MASSNRFEGGEVQDFVRDVRVASQILDRLTLWHATRTALRFAFQAEKYPFVEKISEDSEATTIVQVGIYSPLNYAAVEKTIICNKSEADRSRSFVQATKALFRASGVDFADSEAGATFVYICVDPDDTQVPIHIDAVDRSRSFLQLSGFKHLEFDPFGLSSPIDSHVGVNLYPGDYYSMDFNNDIEKSIPHAVYYMGDPYCISLYINHDKVQ